ncbi:hypothetical protein GCM10009415_43780 [Chitinophaga japonensis]
MAILAKENSFMRDQYFCAANITGKSAYAVVWGKGGPAVSGDYINLVANV